MVSVGAGVDHIVGHDTAYPRHVPLVRMVDPGLSQGMCDYVAWACLSILRRANFLKTEQMAKRWETAPLPTTDMRQVLVLGLGEIGLPVAQTLRGLGFQVSGWSRTEKQIEGLTCYAGDKGLVQALGQADMAVNLLPHTPATADLFNAETFALFKPGAAFINAGRGASVDEDALFQALAIWPSGGGIFGCVQNRTPARPQPLWQHPHVTLTPHNAAITYPASGIRALTRALEEMQAGAPLSNQVDWDRGY